MRQIVVRQIGEGHPFRLGMMSRSSTMSMAFLPRSERQPKLSTLSGHYCKLSTMGRRQHENPFTLASCSVGDMAEGPQTAWSGANLMVSTEALAAAALRQAPALQDVTVHLVRPGEPVRITNVLDAVIPDVKAAHPQSTFPGVLGGLTPAGHGETTRLDGVAVLPVCDWTAAGLTSPGEFPSAFVDMAGPGQAMTAWGDRAAVVVCCTPRPGAAVGDADRSVRMASLQVARLLAESASGRVPDAVESFELAGQADEALPSVAVILQVASEGTLTDTFLYGGALIGMVPTLVDHREILDGALTSGAYDWPAVRNLTAFYQDNALIRALTAAHGSTLRFAGVILALGYLDTAAEKQRSAMLAARLAAQAGADGVICTTFSSGNSHTDTMLTVRACAERGLGTVAIVAETDSGLTDHVPEADSIISTGNTDELVRAWSPGKVIGGSGSAMAGEPVPLYCYLGACVQTGDMALTAVPG
ncbi:MAG TPA: glycine/sarcosine/betaine reductase component B subunit [Streptosporangiaceae bacterium]